MAAGHLVLFLPVCPVFSEFTPAMPVFQASLQEALLFTPKQEGQSLSPTAPLGPSNDHAGSLPFQVCM